MKDQWTQLIEDYPKVAFNWKNFNGTPNGREQGFDHIYIAEPHTLWPENWDVGRLQQYKTVLTWNPKFYEQYHHVINMILLNGCLFCNYELNWLPEGEIIPWEKKKDSCLILNTNYSLGTPGDITWLRSEIAHNLDYPIEIYSPNPNGWPSGRYKGKCESPFHHSHVNQLRLINKYKYCICLESTYHSFWSQGFMTERLFNCLKVQTIPIYMGCFDIEKYVPEHYFVDFRKYFHPTNRKYGDLYSDLRVNKYDLGKTFEASSWNREHKIGSVSELRKVLDNL